MIKHYAKPIYLLILLHMSLIILSNILVQKPFILFGLPTTFGAFTYPFIFVVTDLTIRLKGKVYARAVILKAMLPALLLSYLFSMYVNPHTNYLLDIIALRVVIASFSAYVIGQLMDIIVFTKLRDKAWWLAPSVSSTLGNIVDTFLFFSIAMYKSTDAFLSAHWVEIALVDAAIKGVFILVALVPFYGLLVNTLSERFKKESELSGIEPVTKIT